MTDARGSEIRTDSFVLPLPGGWVDRTVVTLTGPEVDGFAANIVITREVLCDNLGLGGFSSGWVSKLAEEVPVSELRPVEHLEIGDVRAHVRVVGWAAAGLRLTQIAALFVTGEIAYAIVGTAPEWAFDELEARFREAIAGFRLESPVSAL